MAGVTCVKCGKYLWYLPDGGWKNKGLEVEFCTCERQTSKNVQQGWQCPICGAVYAPWVASCGNVHIKLTYSDTTEIKK